MKKATPSAIRRKTYNTPLRIGEQCKVCGVKSDTLPVFNIKFKAVPICETCANAITRQQVNSALLKGD